MVDSVEGAGQINCYNDRTLWRLSFVETVGYRRNDGEEGRGGRTSWAETVL